MFQNAGALKKVVLDVVQNGLNFNQVFSGCLSLKYCEITNCKDAYLFYATFNNCYSLETLKISNWNQKDINLSQSNNLLAESIKYIIWHALNGANTLGFENQGATSRTLTLHATPYASWETWKLTKPSVEDCEFLGIDETEIIKYGELTWEDIALNVKLITIAK
jgi:hypothetical protein